MADAERADHVRAAPGMGSLKIRDPRAFCITQTHAPLGTLTTNIGECDPDLDRDSPLCQNPSGETQPSVSYFYGASPSLRQLQVLGSIGESAVIGSICTKPGEGNQQSLEYRPTVDLLNARLSQVLE